MYQKITIDAIFHKNLTADVIEKWKFRLRL